MSRALKPLDLSRLRVLPLEQRDSLSSIEQILVDPAAPPPPASSPVLDAVRSCAERIIAARRRGAAVILMYGAHLVKNGAQRIVNEL
ncbi:MAG TPA: hypothetical protein PLH97_02425, partial [Verrucomicrobiota bacterium]|nr:hypothetical protein [Verrucomicrobiota bacterium]